MHSSPEPRATVLLAHFFLANVAQSVERRHGKAEVSGSIPDIGSKSKARHFSVAPYFLLYFLHVSTTSAVF